MTASTSAISERSPAAPRAEISAWRSQSAELVRWYSRNASSDETSGPCDPEGRSRVSIL